MHGKTRPAARSLFALAFAGVPQRPRKTFWRLRESRKRLGECREPRAACANVSANAGNLAQPAQTSRQMPGASRGLRKRLGKCRGTCAACANVSVNAGNPASASKNFLVFAGVPQVSRETFWRLREFRKSLEKLFGVCGSPASLLVWRKPKEGSGKNDRVLGDKCIGSNGFASAKKRQSVGIDEDGA